jgi:hypothetical protein
MRAFACGERRSSAERGDPTCCPHPDVGLAEVAIEARLFLLEECRDASRWSGVPIVDNTARGSSAMAPASDLSAAPTTQRSTPRTAAGIAASSSAMSRARRNSSAIGHTSLTRPMGRSRH